ncbi:MAG: VWA domain-containing protein [Bacteroidota bacterium]
MSRRLPVYLLIDTSGSMRGEPIESVNTGLQMMLGSLRQDPFALESVHIAMITYDREVKLVLPLTELEKVHMPHVVAPDSGPTHLGAALEMLCEQADKDIIINTPEHKGDWAPLLFIMTDGSPSDLALYREMLPKVKRRSWANIIACAAGPKAKVDVLKEITDQVYHLATANQSSFAQFFRWVSASVTVGGRSLGSTSTSTLPPPPTELQLVL